MIGFGLLGALLCAVLEGLGIVTSGAGHGSYTGMGMALGPLMLLARDFHSGTSFILLFWLAPALLWGCYGVVAGAAVQRPRIWWVFALLAIVHICCVLVGRHF